MFDKVTAMDPAPDMLQEAKKKVNLKTRSNQAVEFRQGGAEDLDFLDDASVDLIVAATAGAASCFAHPFLSSGISL